MKIIRNACLIIGISLVNLLYAQDSATISDNNPLNEDVSGLSDYEVELRAIEMTPTVPADSVSRFGNYYSAAHAPGTKGQWPPLPGNLLGLNVWPLNTNIFLLDDLNVNYSALAAQQSQDEMQPMLVGPPVPGGGSGTNSPPPAPQLSLPDYSTNLWIAQWSMNSNGISGIASNTLADVEYDVETNSDLTTTNWVSTGQFILGSELTNWTPLAMMPVGATNNLFFRLRSWQSSDGSGIPDWWELTYFGHTGVDPNAQDSAGDGWTIWQKYEMGENPNTFVTPPAPQGVTVSYNPDTDLVTVSWLPSPGPVTGYTVNMNGTDYTVSSETFSFTNNGADDDLFSGIEYGEADPNLYADFQVQASYAGGDSAQSTQVPLEENSLNASLVAGSQGAAYLIIPALPPGTAIIRLTRVDLYDVGAYGDASFNTNFDIPVSDFTNGVCILPVPISATSATDGYGESEYQWWVQPIAADGTGGAYSELGNGYSDNYPDDVESDYILQTGSWPVTPYFDGREQLKQNLIFLLRAGLADALPFQFSERDQYNNYGNYAYPTNYAYASFYQSGDLMDLVYNPAATLDVFTPFGENYLYRNFIFDLSNVNSYGLLNNFGNSDLQLTLPPTYQFEAPTVSGASIPAVLSTNDTRWLFLYYPTVGSGTGDFTPIGITYLDDNNQMANDALNSFGLPFLSTEIVWGNGDTQNYTLYAGDSYNDPYNNYFYSETAQPQLQTVEYDFWNPPIGPYFSDTNPISALPGMPDFSPTNQSQSPFFTGVGQSNFRVAGYAKEAILNGYTNVFGYLGQYFDAAYQMDDNGNVTTNSAGILSPYGDFFPTYPGAAALVTMPDIDTGEQGTCTVYCVSLNVDANHDGNMDLNSTGADATSQSQPMEVWANNNYDRWKYDLLGLTYEQDDTEIATEPDYNYTTNGLPAIPCPRDLEDYFRLWTPGLAALMKVLPDNYTVQLILSGDGQIRIFQAIEPDGGTNYLFDETTASNQVANASSLYVGLLTSSSPIVFNISTNFNEHFIFCGAATGNAQIDLQVLDANQNVVADAPLYLQINDIKQMYERWTVGDNPNNTPASTPYLVTDGLLDGEPAFQYPPPQDTNTPYILFVHGWNMEPWEKDRFAETAFKRLYWQGYQGRFGEFRWPTYFDFPLGSWSWQSFDLRNYDDSESNAWASAVGLLNKLNDLKAEYPNKVYLIAHSMGNVVAGEALRKATGQVVNTYEALQGAIASHAYDTNTPIRDLSASTPDDYAHYWTNGAPCYFNNNTGAKTNVNFFNSVDWALTQLWPLDQNTKPDHSMMSYPGYYYSVSSLHPNGFYVQFGSGTNDFHNLNFPTDTYTIFSFCDEASSYALGSQEDVGGIFNGNQVALNNSPYFFGQNHVDHSGEFRSDNARRAPFWNQILVKMNLK